MVRACGTNVQKKKVYRLFMGIPEGEKPLRRPRSRWVYNMKTNFCERGWGPVGDCYECGTETSACITLDFLDWLYNWWTLEYSSVL
jgi:hypothetical protein